MSARALTITAVAVLLVYAALPTKNYYWDGVSFALSIEGMRDLGPAIIHPNHLVYNPVGLAMWSALNAGGIHVRALYLLQAINIALGAVCVWVLMRIVLRATGSEYLSVSLGALFAFSSHWWKFATDADAYIPSVLLLLLAFRELLRSQPRPSLVVFLHVAAMLAHQLAVVFFPVAALGLLWKRGWRTVASCSALAAALTLAGYYAGFRLDDAVQRPRTFGAWITSHAGEADFTLNPLHNLAASATSYLRLFLGGRVRLFRDFFDPFAALCALAFLAALTGLIVQLVRGRRDWKFAGRWNCGLAFVWIASYAVFLFFWLPQNTFYKLFLLPPVFYVAGCALTRYTGPRRYRLAFLTVAVAFSNLTLSIYPYTHASANVPLTFAHRVGKHWSENTVVFYQGYGPDDWTIRYFNPRTTWIRMWGNLDWPEREAAKGKDVWLDTTASDLFPPERLGPGEQVVTSKNRIRFFRYSASSASLR